MLRVRMGVSLALIIRRRHERGTSLVPFASSKRSVVAGVDWVWNRTGSNRVVDNISV